MFARVLGVTKPPASVGSLRAHWLKSAATGVLLQGLGLALAFGSGVLIARLLGPTRLGVYAFALALAGAASVPAALGLPVAVTRFLALYKTQRQWELGHGLLRRANQLVGLASCVAIIALIIYGVAAQTGEQLVVTLIAAALIPLLALTALRQRAIQALDHPIAAQLPEQLVKHTVFLLVTGLLVFAAIGRARDPTGLMVIWVAASTAAFLAGILLLRRASPRPLRDACPRYDTGRWIRVATPMLFANTAGVVYMTVDIILLGVMRPPMDVGFYQVAVRAAALMLVFVGASNYVLAPWFARLHAGGDRVRLARVVRRTTLAVLAATLLVFAAFACWGRDLIGLIFGTEYLPAYNALLVLGGARVVDVVAGPVVNLLNMTGGQIAVAKTVAVTAAMNVVGCVLLIPHFGIMGAAASSAIAMVTANVVLAIIVRRRLGIQSFVFGRAV